MANSEPDFNIDTTTIQEDEWVIYLKILIDNFASMFFSLLSACPKQMFSYLYKTPIGFVYSMMLIRFNKSN